MNALKAVVRRAAKRFGYDIVRTPQIDIPTQSLPYGTVLPVATYSPWIRDQTFQSIYRAISDNTLVDEYRCFELWKLAEQVAKLKTGSIVEVGVWRGGTGALFAAQARQCGIRDTVYLCDTFTGVVKAGEKDSDYKGGEHADTNRHTVENLLRSQAVLDNVEILEGIFPDQTGHLIQNVQFRLCHIDVDVYKSAKDIVDWIWPKMVPGGIIVYDDYGFCTCDGITKYVEEQMPYDDRLVIHNLNGHAIIIKL